MDKRKTILNAAQADLVAELCTTYGIDPDDVVFFDDTLNPLFGYEASCILLNRLTDVVDRELEPVTSVSTDAVSRRCRLAFPDGGSSFIGVANVAEADKDGKPLSPIQIEWLADSRAIRGAIRAKGINLLKLHYERRGLKLADAAAASKPAFARQLAEVHVLGQEAGLIKGGSVVDRSLWYSALDLRYGVSSSKDLNEEQLSDFAAFLRSRIERSRAQAA